MSVSDSLAVVNSAGKCSHAVSVSCPGSTVVMTTARPGTSTPGSACRPGCFPNAASGRLTAVSPELSAAH